MVRICLESGFPYERLFAHFRENTVINVPFTSVPEVEIAGRAAGIINNLQTTGALPVDLLRSYRSTLSGSERISLLSGLLPPNPDQLDTFQFGLYIGFHEPVHELQFTVSSHGSGFIAPLIIAYPTLQDDRSLGVYGWRMAVVESDGTVGNSGPFTTSGTIRFRTDPTKWVRGTLPFTTWQTITYNTSYPQNIYLTSACPLYWVRVIACYSSTAPLLSGVRSPRLQQWVSNAGQSHTVVIYGWRDEQDEGDGWIPPGTPRQYPEATAEWKHQSRFGPGFTFSIPSSTFPLSTAVLRIWDDSVVEILKEAVIRSNHEDYGLNGVIIRSVRINEPAPLWTLNTGGRLSDGFSNDPIDTSSFESGFRSYLLSTIDKISRARPASFFIMQGLRHTERVYVNDQNLAEPSLSLVEDVDGYEYTRKIHDWRGLWGHAGISTDWEQFAMMRAGKQMLLESTPHIHLMVGADQAGWTRSLELCTVQLLLRWVPYLAHLTIADPARLAQGWMTAQSANFWKSGVPIHIAYLPVMVTNQLGAPISIPDGYTPIPLLRGDVITYSSGSVIGNSTSTQVTVPVAGQNRQIQLIPSNVFLITPSSVNQERQDAVIARRFQKGLVVARVLTSLGVAGQPSPYHPGDMQFSQSTLQVTLPGTYRRLFLSGDVGQPTTTVTLRGWEAAIFLNP